MDSRLRKSTVLDVKSAKVELGKEKVDSRLNFLLISMTNQQKVELGEGKMHSRLKNPLDFDDKSAES